MLKKTKVKVQLVTFLSYKPKESEDAGKELRNNQSELSSPLNLIEERISICKSRLGTCKSWLTGLIYCQRVVLVAPLFTCVFFSHQFGVSYSIRDTLLSDVHRSTFNLELQQGRNDSVTEHFEKKIGPINTKRPHNAILP